MSWDLQAYQFQKPDLLVQALTHKSFVNENGRRHLLHNEKLEFLGDAVLDLVLSEYLMEAFPQDDEGNLSKKRASLVNETVLAQIAHDLGLPERLNLGKGEILSEGNKKPRLLASAYEALLGAIFLDGGYEIAKQVIKANFDKLISAMNPAEDFVQDYKTRLQELTQAELKTSPVYDVIGEQGPSHNPKFEVSLSLQGKIVGTGIGKSKKIAEQEAARITIENWPQILAENSLRKNNV